MQQTGLELAGSSSPECLDDLFICEYSKVVRIITRIIRDQAHAEDFAIDVFLKILRPNLNMATASAVLYRQAVRTALDEVRRRNRRDRLQKLFSSFVVAAMHSEKDYVIRERQFRVGLILRDMIQRDAELLILRAESLTYAELSNVLGINSASVGVMLSRAQSSFKKEYLKRYGQPD